MTFTDAIKTCFSKYADFNGRASRSEYWNFFLFTILVTIAFNMLGRPMGIMMLSMVFSLATLLPSLAVGARRLHDTNRSGWMLLIGLIPLVGWIVLIVFLVQEPKEPNQYGAAPDASPGVLLP